MAFQHLKQFVLCAGSESDASTGPCTRCNCAENDTFSTGALTLLCEQVKRKCADAFDILSLQDAELPSIKGAWICEFASGFAALHDFTPRFEPVEVLRELPNSAATVQLAEAYSKERREIVVWIILNQFESDDDDEMGNSINTTHRPATTGRVECTFLLSPRGAAAVRATTATDTSFLC
jgi:hypothetical protein